MKIIADNNAVDHRRFDGRSGSIRQAVSLDRIGDELRGLYGNVDQEPMPDALTALAALLEGGADRGDPASSS